MEKSFGETNEWREARDSVTLYLLVALTVQERVFFWQAARVFLVNLSERLARRIS